MFSDCLWRHLHSLKEFLGMLHQLLRKYEQIKQMPTQWCFFFFFHCGHAECDLFCQLLLFLDANAVSVSFALEGMLPVEASFWNRSIVCFPRREQLESGAGSVCVCPGSFMWCAYGGRWADLPRAERKGLTLIQENQRGQKWRWHTLAPNQIRYYSFILFSYGMAENPRTWVGEGSGLLFVG